VPAQTGVSAANPLATPDVTPAALPAAMPAASPAASPAATPAPASRWDGPWLDPVRRGLAEAGDAALAGRWDACAARLSALAAERGLVNENGRPIRFVDARGVHADAYEAHIWRTGEVPTRADAAGAWHDFFNALVWLAFPRTKARLNRLQARRIETDGIGARRGGVRDAATLFDENAVLVPCADARAAAALRAFDWRALFVARRADFSDAMAVLGFGHALMDKLRAPFKGVCAHAWVLEGGEAAAIVRALRDAPPGAGLEPALAARLDALAAASLDEASLRPERFTPLPVLGVPGWWPGNADPAFYDDVRVFRPGRARRAGGRAPQPAPRRQPDSPRAGP